MDMAIPITALGCCSALGPLDTAAAAYRAGLSRATAIACATIDSDDGPQPVTGHPARPHAEGFDQVGGWVRMAHEALDDLAAREAWNPSTWQRLRPDTGVILIAPAIDLDRFGWGTEHQAHVLRTVVLAPLLDARFGPLLDDHVAVCTGGAEASSRGLALVQERLRNGTWKRALIIAVDSLLDPSSASWLLSAGRLKLDDQPNGLIPGEAAVALLLEPVPSFAEPSGADLTAAITVPPSSGEPTPASRSDALWQAFSALAAGSTTHADHYLDLNGEAWRSAAWGHFVPRLAGVQSGRIWHPVEGFGDVGAASGLLGCALAARAWARGYAGGDRALLWLQDLTNGAGVVALQRHPSIRSTP